MKEEKYKVLIVEDDVNTLKQMDEIIKGEGFSTLLAENGERGLEIFYQDKPDIIITDLKLSGISGIELMSKIKESTTLTQIILVTAFGGDAAAISSLQKGAIDYIKKPIDLDILLLALGRAKEKVIEFKDNIPYPSILLVEDEEVARKYIVEALEDDKWKIFEAGDGEEALNIFKKNKIDIVLTDIKMPKKNGIQVLHEMREITNDFEGIIISGYGDENDAIQAMRDGAMTFIRKPVDLDQMTLTIEKAIEKLNLSRVLKYRLRELELANKIINKMQENTPDV